MSQIRLAPGVIVDPPTHVTVCVAAACTGDVANKDTRLITVPAPDTHLAHVSVTVEVYQVNRTLTAHADVPLTKKKFCGSQYTISLQATMHPDGTLTPGS